MIINNLNAVGKAYDALRNNGLVRNKADFSKWYLAKSASYLRSMQARSRTVPDATLAMLEWSLQREILNFSFNPHLGQPYAVALNAGYECLQHELANIRRYRHVPGQPTDQLPVNNKGDSSVVDGSKTNLKTSRTNLQSFSRPEGCS